ncbi:MAG: hypothetical protein D6824_07385 [Planctomycetota bacterium]|nr:MAG: hypothetical protein D6824_07385 [Planctomycetota bacterium]
MRSDLPKVLHQAAGRPLVRWVVDAARQAGARPIVLVVGYGRDQVKEALAGEEDLRFVTQEEQLGTGHAVGQAESLVRESGAEDVFVLCGDGPLVRPETLERLARRRRETGAACALATATLDDPSGYGRTLRDEGGRFLGFVEEKNATPQQLAIREVNPSYYCFEVGPLFAALGKVERDAVSGEFYLTDVPPLLAKQGCRVEVVEGIEPEEALSVNTPQQLAQAEQALLRRVEGPAGR